MELQNEILINQYGQDLIKADIILDIFKMLDLDRKKTYLNDLIILIMQSKPKDSDICVAINTSNLKPNSTPCIMLKKGVANHFLIKIIELPEYELEKSLKLLLSLFKIAYQRRFKEEKNNPNKWWYWDLSKKDNIESILNLIK